MNGNRHDPTLPPTSPGIQGRKSYQARRGGVRQSEEFDRRFDGPFGRPSLVMTRRRSSLVTPGVLASPGATAPGQPADLEKQAQEGGAQGILGSEAPPFLPEPPSLNYTLRTRKLSIFIFWFLIVFDSVVLPIALYFALWYGVGPGTNTPTERKQKLSANAVFSIVTAAVGGASIVEYFVRLRRLWRKNSTCRVIGARRWYLDAFHWNYSLGWIVVMVELIVGTVPEFPPIRLLSMPVPTMVFVLATELLVVDILRVFHVPAPVRISSVPKGAQLRPGIYSLIEDICAVDGSGGTEFRTALDTRYAASHIFRTMLRRLGVFWAVGGEACAIVCTILIFTINAEAGYVIGWSVPFIWGGVWTLCTFWYVNKQLKIERQEWSKEVATLESVTPDDNRS
ncbi:hypothetical protein CONLIGDRAFT_585313 [Coniochaeta ligniaria NRRL 30616]|uniref:Uncharacterized protein n=1 Tax=Coniochaeta ligniaria NRRL 30616 TaxID=1408157 RepID=A0A1J7J3R2_9PEZI|nr:hypothetical protein CONLIGDRAFT_585313 [Coniochaeta ligniaria NRRL 30616]